MISIKNISKAAVLAALYNASRPQGMGFLNYDPKPMTEDEAAKLISTRGTSFDYLKGRVMKVDISGDELDPWLYDRDNGQGAAERALAALHIFQNPDNPETRTTHQHGKKVAAEAAKAMIEKPTTIDVHPGKIAVVRMGLDNVKEPLSKAIAKAE